MAQKLSRQDAFELLQKTYIEECKNFYMVNKLERDVIQAVRKIQQCKSLEDLVRLIINTGYYNDLLDLYAKALIETP